MERVSIGAGGTTEGSDTGLWVMRAILHRAQSREFGDRMCYFGYARLDV